MSNKTADDIFRELGLVREVANTIYTIFGDEERSIIFNNDYKEIQIDNIRYLNLKLLQAINKKVEELGWLDE